MMRSVVLALSAITLASAAPPEKAGLNLPNYEKPAKPWTDVEEALRKERCNQAIRDVRDASDQPDLDRQPSTGKEAMMIAAVDQKVDDCPVLVMYNDKSDIRPVPEGESELRLRPATGNQD